MNHDFSHLHVEFYTEAVHNVRRSAEEGRPFYDDVEMVRIRIAGDKGTVFAARAEDASTFRDETGRRLTYRELHAGPYEAFKRNAVYQGEGTPLSDVPCVSLAKRKELALSNIYTAEVFADLDGSNLAKLGMGARELRDQVKAWLEKTSKNADVAKLATENEELRKRLERMEQMLMAKEPAAPAEAPPHDASTSPFADWDDETISLWIVEQGGEKPHHKCSHETLVAKADELNAKLSRNKAA